MDDNREEWIDNQIV